MKYGMTADGKIATVTGESKWITTEKSREKVHKTRNDLSSIMVGIGTVLKDDPLLTCRTTDGKNPIRIICDSQLKLPLSSKIVKTAKNIKTVVATISEDNNKIQILENLGVEVITVSNLNERLDLNDLMKKLWNIFHLLQYYRRVLYRLILFWL